MSLISRRRLLLGTLATGLVTACSTDPRIIGGPSTPPPEPTPTPLPKLPGLDAALTSEADLAALTRQYATVASLRLSPAMAATTQSMADSHEAHLKTLVLPRPETRPNPAATPAPGENPRPMPASAARLPTGDRAAAVRTLTDRYARAASDYRQNALGSNGSVALLWGSLAAYAQAASVALTVDVARPPVPEQANRPVVIWSDTEALQQVLRQVHALIYGYQCALAPLRRPDLQPVADLLQRRRDLRMKLSSMLRDLGLAVPAAEPVYALPVRPVDRRSVAELIWQMESAFATFVGPWLASATKDPSRNMALDALVECSRISLQWEGPLPVWPGWPS